MHTPRSYTGIFAVSLSLGIFSSGYSLHAQEKKPVQAKAGEEFTKVLVPFLEKHCYACHGPAKQRAGIAFQLYKDEQALIKNRKIWHSVQDMVHSGEMPPQEKKRPSVQETDAFLQALQEIFLRADRSGKRDPGQVTMRRLNRVEYKNTIRDLMGVVFRLPTICPRTTSATASTTSATC